MTADQAPSQPPISTRADRFLRACRREPVDATPVWFMRQAGRSLPAYRAIRKHVSLLEITADPALCAQVTLQPVERLGVDAAILFADITSPLPGMGVPLEIREGVGPVIDPPVDSLAGIRELRPFQPEQAVAPLLEAIRLIRRESSVPLIGFAGAPFTLASYLVTGRSSRDAEGVKALMRREPETFDALLSRLVDTTIAYVNAQVGAGVQAIQLFDSWVGTLSPFDYQRSVLPHMRRLFDGLRPLGVPLIHFGTGSAGLLALQAEAGGDVIGLDWRIGLDEGWSRVPDRGVQGNLDPTALLGPWSGVEGQARWVLTQAGGRAGHVFNLGHGVLPATDPDHLRRLVDLVHEETAR